MKSNSERGVALVTTLIMLSLVTFMAVVFLAVSRREKASVTVAQDIITARLMADAAVARAQSEVATRYLTSTNLSAYDYLISTNYYLSNGFQTAIAGIDPRNVNYEHLGSPTGPPLNAANQAVWLRNIANLQFDPRPPVFLSTNLTGLRTNDFRFYLDLNRNGQFEPTGYLLSTEKRETNFYMGDPQWIGVLEFPDRPHSESNRFIGRFAFVVVPTGKALDLNYIANDAKRLRVDMSLAGYMRNQGVGSWEINLAAFLRDLNTNIWPAASYSYNSNPTFPSTGWAFEDARDILRHRYDSNLNTLASARLLFNFPPNPNNPFARSGVDYYSDGPTQPAVTSIDNVDLPWPGSSNPDGFYDVQELFDPTKVSFPFANRLLTLPSISSAVVETYNRYTYYRLLSQLSTDSQPSESNKVYFADYRRHYTNRMHLLYQNPVPNGQTNFIPWTPVSFFTNAADRLIRASLNPLRWTNGAPQVRLQTNFLMGVTPVRDVFSITNIQLYHVDAGRVNPNIPYWATNYEYSATVHRLLQVAANIHDTQTNSYYPSVFRPVFMRTATNLIIRGFVEETNALFLDYPWMTVEQAMGVQQPPAGVPAMAPGLVYTNRNLYGVPVVIGAKKGFPNFNKLVVQTVADISRRVEILKPSPQSVPSETNQMYQIAVTNRFAVEGWNSYIKEFLPLNRSSKLELRVGVEGTMALHHIREGDSLERPPVLTAFATNMVWQTNRWPGSPNLQSATASFVVPIDATVTSLTNSIYFAQSGVLTNAGLALLSGRNAMFEKSFRVPQWYLVMTNRLQYFLVDQTANRLIDFVNLDRLTMQVDVTKGLMGDTNAGGGGIFGDKARGAGGNRATPLTDSDMWNPQHVAGPDSPTLGVLSQIQVAKGDPFAAEGTWANPSGQPQSVQGQVDTFKAFLIGQGTNLAMQVPFTPSRTLYLRTSFEANDPLVHYTTEDLMDPTATGLSNSLPVAVARIQINDKLKNDARLRQVNARFRPWGGNPQNMRNNDNTAMALTVKDPLVHRSDDWLFPTNFPNLGWLGRVHRGTPWQTIYLKAAVDPTTGPLDDKTWQQWSGSFGTHPTNDWKLLDVFTVAPNDNAGRGLLGVNQTNTAAWSAVLSGLTVNTNSSADNAVGSSRRSQLTPMVIQPASPQIYTIVDGINRRRTQFGRPYQTLGEVLSVPELTVFSPYLRLSAKQTQYGIDDATYEQIPQQVLSLLRTDEPRVTIYAFGQALRPAERSLVTAAGYFNLCTNYQITGEFATKTVVRLEDLPPEPASSRLDIPAAEKMRAVVESYSVLQPD